MFNKFDIPRSTTWTIYPDRMVSNSGYEIKAREYFECVEDKQYLSFLMSGIARFPELFDFENFVAALDEALKAWSPNGKYWEASVRKATTYQHVMRRIAEGPRKDAFVLVRKERV